VISVGDLGVDGLDSETEDTQFAERIAGPRTRLGRLR
jgi:hypothetical protein